MILYKYRTDSERTEEIIRTKKVWFAKPESLNDPFECSIQEVATRSLELCIEQEKKEQLEGFVFSYLISPDNKLMWGLPKQNVKKVLDKIAKAQDFQVKYGIYAEFIKSRTGNYPSSPELKYLTIPSIIQNVGIFSLSETCDNELMWGHYADGGNGIAIGFSVTETESITPNSICIRVNYTNDPVVLKDRLSGILAFTIDNNGNPSFFQAAAFDDPFLKSVMSTKNTSWAYEKEWRCIEQAHGLRSFTVPITEIVFGLKCSLATRKKYTDLVNNYCPTPVSFFEIVLNGRKLDKRPVQIT